jgi:hypothetical protein
MSVDLKRQQTCRGDVVAICALGRRLWHEEPRQDDWVAEAERCLVARLLAPMWNTLDDDRQDEVRQIIANECDDAEFAFVGLDTMVRDSRLRMWLSAQSDLTIGDALSYLVTGEPPVAESEVERR